jgi:hypothetical protein
MQRVESKEVAGGGATETVENKRVILQGRSVGKCELVGMLTRIVIGSVQNTERVWVTRRGWV